MDEALTYKNCWEIMNCGRGPDNKDVDPKDKCPAASSEESDGTNRGEKGGRFCWAIAGTLCGGKVQGMFAAKIDSCFNCEFFKMVAE